MITRRNLDELPDLLTGVEAAAAIGYSAGYYYRLRRHGMFPLRPLNRPGVPRYTKKSVLQYLDSLGSRKSA